MWPAEGQQNCNAVRSPKALGTFGLMLLIMFLLLVLSCANNNSIVRLFAGFHVCFNSKYVY